MKPSEHLTKARDILTPEGAWTQGESWRDANGNPCDPDRAASYCTMGAINSACNSAGMPSFENETRSRAFLKRAIKSSFIVDWNDTPNRTQADVIAAFDGAIALAQSEGM